MSFFGWHNLYLSAVLSQCFRWSKKPPALSVFVVKILFLSNEIIFLDIKSLNENIFIKYKTEKFSKFEGLKFIPAGLSKYRSDAKLMIEF